MADLRLNPRWGDPAKFMTDASGNVTGILKPQTDQTRSPVAVWAADGSGLLGLDGTLAAAQLAHASAHMGIGLGAPVGYARPRVLLFGNSINEQNMRWIGPKNHTTTVSADAAAGATALSVTSGAGIANADKVAIMLADGSFFLTTVSSGGGTTTITLAAALPRRASSAQSSVTVYTGKDLPLGISQGIGIVTGALAQLGNPAEIISVQGNSGAKAYSMLMTLGWYLKQYAPAYVVFCGLHENDLAASVTAARCITQVKAAAALCLSARAVPVFMTPVPADSYGTGAIATEFDTLRAWMTGTLPTAFGVTIPVIDASSPWLDTTGGYRKPLTSVSSDGIHPDVAKRWTAATNFVSAFSAIFGTRSSLADLSWSSNPTMSGTGGSAVNVTNSGVADGYRITQTNAPGTVTASKTAEGYQKISMSSATNTATAPIFKALIYPAMTFNNPDLAKYVAVRGFAKLRINTLTGCDWLGPIFLNNGTDDIGSGGKSSTNSQFVGTDAALVGKTITLETHAVPVPLRGSGTDYLDFAVYIVGIPSVTCAIDVDIVEMGWEICQPDEIFYS